MNIRGRLSQAGVPSEQPHSDDGWPLYEQLYRRSYRDAIYYSSGRGWPDYAPAYRYGYDNYGRYRGRRFEEIETFLERDWPGGRAESRLAWAEARGAVRDIWQRIDQDAAGERDRRADRRQ